jgi:two-component system chemotaxis response regulator CheB
MTRTRVVVVDDSATVRAYLSEVLRADPDIDVIAEAGDGQRAVQLCESLRPDAITMDMMLPLMSGLAATEYVMAHCPTPILIVSSSMNRGELLMTCDALAAGAVDVLEKPSGQEADGAWEQEFIASVKMVARIRVITHPGLRVRGRARPRDQRPVVPPVRQLRETYSVAAVGASTGGPAALVEFLRGLSPEFSLPVLFVLHIGEPFGTTFAEWLDGQTDRRVSVARDGQPISSLTGQIIMAPANHHLTVRGGALALNRDAERHSCRPSVDVLFESVAREYGPRAAACLMTGMGCDGAAGLGAVHDGGGLTIAQDEATSVVYGMPREAVLRGAAQHVLPLDEIGPALSALTVFGTPQRSARR